MFEATRDVPLAWAADLARLCLGERVSQLRLSWLAGMPYAPVGRWVIYEVLPKDAIGKMLDDERHAHISGSLLSGLWRDLEGPDPRTTGKWVPDPTVAGGRRWTSKSLISRNQWDLHRETGGFPLLCWIIEGEHGGHSWQMGPFEQSFLLAAGVPPDDVQALTEAWPDPGSQPYADYDQRVFHALAERDLLRQWRQSLAWEDRSQRSHAGLILARETASRRTDMLARVLRWLDGQIGDAVSDVPRSLLPQWSEFQPTDTPYADDESLHTKLTEGA